MIARGAVPGLLLLILLAVVAQLTPLALLLTLVLVTSVFVFVWGGQALRNVEYARRFSQSRAFFGEEITLAVEITNRKLLPLAWIEVDDEVPDALVIGNRSLFPAAKPKRSLLSNVYSLGPYEKVTRRYRVHCVARGWWEFGQAEARSGDVFGLGQQTKPVGGIDHLLVYPRLVAVEQLGLPARQPFGDYRARQRLFEDPAWARGIRPFEPGDPLRRVHWAATARTGQLQVKQFDATATLDLYLVLNIATYELTWQGVQPELFETAISVAASLVHHALGDGWPVGLLANSNLPGDERPIKIPPARGAEHLTRLLEAFAKLTPFVATPIDDLIRDERRTLPWTATIVVVSAVLTEPLAAQLLALHRAGHPVTLVLISDDAPPVGLSGVTVYRVTPAALADETASLILA